jgi:NADH-quinone oxidoreductase subunit N
MLVDLAVKGERRTPSFVLAQLILAAGALVTLFVWGVKPDAKLLLFDRMFVFDALSERAEARGLCRRVRRARLLAALPAGSRAAARRVPHAAAVRAARHPVMISANSLLSLYLGLELLSLCLYALVALNRDSAVATEAAMKYFVLGALASGLLLYGMSMIYGATGTLVLDEVAARAAGLAADSAARASCWSSGWCSWSRAWPSSWAWCPSTCGFPTSTRARPPR